MISMESAIKHVPEAKRIRFWNFPVPIRLIASSIDMT
jgi:hypothetical protein